MEWLTTSTILERLHRFEDRGVWDLLVEHFHTPVVRLAEGMGLSASDAQDAAQETLLAFAEAYRAGKFDRNKGRLKHWLFGIAHRQGLKARERTRRDRSRRGGGVELEDLRDLSSEEELQELWESEWRWAIYQKALRRVEQEVTLETFKTFQLLVAEKVSVEDVCERLGVTRSTVYNAKHRVARRLAQLVEEYQDA